MVSASKILTVSYGTFSCTLEGFDDSFDTMKAIAEYFRDLAADDRYFGAEPPTPDADMLARIAEREISRRVQAHEEQGKIVLRAQDDTAQEAPTGTALAAATAPDQGTAQEAQTHDTPEQSSAHPLAALSADTGHADTGDTADRETARDVAQETVQDTADRTTPDQAEPAVDAPTEDAPKSEAAQAPEPEAAKTPEPETEADTETGENAIIAAASETPDEATTTQPEVAHTTPAEAKAENDIAETEDAKAGSQEDDAPVAVPVPDAVPQAAPVEASLPDEDSAEEADLDVAQMIAEPAQVEDADEEDSVAAKLRRIRSVVVQKELDYEINEYSEDQHAIEPRSDASAELDALLASAPEDEDDFATTSDARGEDHDAEGAGDDFDLDAFMANAGPSVDDELTSSFDWSDATPEPGKAPESDAADARDDMQDDTPLRADGTPPVEDTLAQILADSMPDETLEDDAPEDVLSAMPDPEQDVPQSPEPALLLGDDIRISETAEPETDATSVNAQVVKVKREEFEAAVERGVIEEDHADSPAEPEPETAEPETAHITDDDLSPEEEAELQRELAEVEAELGLQNDAPTAAAEAEVEATEAPTATHAEAQDEAQDDAFADPETAETTAVTEDEDEVGERVQDHAEDLGDDRAGDEADTADATPAAEAEAAPAAKPRRGLARLISGVKRQPEDVERLFDEADTQMGDQENSMRRNAIQHLRAAVAATRAEKKAGGQIDEGVDDAPYRSDLAEVVRPRRPSADGASAMPATTRPREQRPAPLKLVAEQRVDRERAPVRPRRVVTADLEPQDATSVDGAGFSEFAANLGATDLSDLLEAAAAYMSDVEGRPEFSRPMLMSKLKEVAAEDFTREDGLRSFGQLLREGKLRKIKGGRFSVTDHTEFREQARSAG